jgi:hypothetical protein
VQTSMPNRPAGAWPTADQRLVRRAAWTWLLQRGWDLRARRHAVGIGSRDRQGPRTEAGPVTLQPGGEDEVAVPQLGGSERNTTFLAKSSVISYSSSTVRHMWILDPEHLC